MTKRPIERSEPTDLSGNRQIRRCSGAPSFIVELMLKHGKPLKTMKPYKICQCPNCGEIQVTTGKNLVCTYCNTHREFRIDGKWNVKLQQANTQEAATEFCKFWKRCDKKGMRFAEVVEQFEDYIGQRRRPI